MRGVHQHLIGQREQFLGHAVVQHLGITVLKIRSPAAVDQQRVAAEQPVAPAIGEMAVGVARGVQRVDANTAHLERHTLCRTHVHARQTFHRRRGDFAAHALAQVQGRRDVIGMDVRVERVCQPQPQRLQRRKIAVDGVDHGIDQQRLAGRLAAQ